MTPGQPGPAGPHDLTAQRAASLTSASGDAHARRDRVIKALGDFQEAAQAATAHWGRQDFTIRQGLGVTWMLGNILRDLRIATGSAGNLGLADGPGADTGTQLHRLLRRLRYGDPRPPATPRAEIAGATHNLHMAQQQAITVSTRYGPQWATGLPHDVPAITAAIEMQAALGAADGVWLIPPDDDQDRDQVVTQLLYAVDRLEAAALVLSQGGPADTQYPLRSLALSLDWCCHCLRESVVCSLTGGYQPGTEDLARQVRAGHPLISKTSQSPFPPPFDFSDEAPEEAGISFPVPANTAAPAAEPRSPEHRPAREQRPGTPRKNP